MKNEKQIYEIDQAMLGHLFCGDVGDLKNFCNIFEAEMGAEYRKYIKIVPVESFNGASRVPGIFIPATGWNKAIDRHVKAYPEAWAI